MTDMAEVFEDGGPRIEISVSLAMLTVAIVAWAVSFWHSLLALQRSAMVVMGALLVALSVMVGQLLREGQ